jgi:hypothetical protein
VSSLSSGAVSRDVLAWLDATNQSALAPVVVRTGVHCIEASKDESYHRLEFHLDGVGGKPRVVVYVTLAPATSMFHPPSSASELFHRKRVTQFQVWVEGPHQQHAGNVVAYRSRAPLPSCGVVG